MKKYKKYPSNFPFAGISCDKCNPFEELNQDYCCFAVGRMLTEGIKAKRALAKLAISLVGATSPVQIVHISARETNESSRS